MDDRTGLKRSVLLFYAPVSEKTHGFNRGMKANKYISTLYLIGDLKVFVKELRLGLESVERPAHRRKAGALVRAHRSPRLKSWEQSQQRSLEAWKCGLRQMQFANN